MPSNWLRRLLNRVVRSTVDERNASRKKSRTRTRAHNVELLDVRLVLAATTFNGGILTVDLNSDNEAAILTNDGTNISLTSNVAITGVGGSSFSTANVTKIMITNVINKPGQSIVFAGTAAYSLSDGLASSGVETNTFNVGVTATGAASISVTAPQSIVVSANLTGGTGGTTLLGQGLAVLNTDGVTVQSGAVVSATGNVSVTGQGGSGSGGNNHGVYLVLSGRITAGGTGTVTVSGTGGSGSGDNNYGVYAFNPNNAAGNSTITSGAGTLTVSGTGGSGSGSLNHGVFVRGIGSAISSGGGNVDVTGQGGGGGGSGNTNYGVYLLLRGKITATGSGATTVSGTGGSSSGGGNTGVYMNQTGSDIRSSGGNVSVTGQGGSGGGDNNWGVYLTGQAVIVAGGSGTVTVSGTGGSGSGSLNHGVYVGGFGSSNASITSGGGNVSVTGQGGGGSGAGGSNFGVHVYSSSEISAGGSGTVTVSGTGGSGSGDDNNGVVVNGINSVTNSLPLDDPAWQGLSGITSGGGNVIVTGEGGGGSGDRNTGVVVSGGGGVGVDIFFVRGKISAGGSGTVTVTGTGGSGTGSGHYGVYVKDNTNVKITSGGGRVSVIGTGTANSEGVRLENSGTITSGSNAAITVTADSVNILVGSTTHSRSGTTQTARIQALIDALVADSTINSGSGTTTIQTRTAGTQIDLGGTDVLSGTLTLGLTDAELDQITAGTIQIGNASSGAITVSAAITPSGSSNLSLTTGANVIDGNASAGSDLTVPTISIVATTGISTSGNPLEVNASTFANVQTATGGIYIDIQDSGDVGHTVTSASATTSGDVVFTASTGGGTNTYVFNSVTAANGDIDLSKSVGGNINVGNLNAAGTTGKTISVNVGTGNADSISHLGGTTIQTNGGQIALVANQMTLGGSSITSGSNGPITVTADSVNILAGSTINSGSGTTTIQTRTAGTQIDLGGADVLLGTLTLGLTDAELDQITAGTIQIGNASSGVITVSAAITPSATSNLSLTTGANVIDGNAPAGSDLTVATISIVASTGISTSGNPLEVNASTFANVQTATGGIYIDIQDSGDVGHTVTLASATTSGDVVFTASTGGGTNTHVFTSVTAANGNIDLSKSVGGNINVGTLNAAGTAGKTISVNVGSGNADAISHLRGTTIQTNGGQISLVANQMTLGGSSITSGSNGPITVTADSVNILAGSTINSGSGTTTIQTRTAGTQIDLGGADVLSGTLTLGLTDAELDQITAGTIQVGNANSGAITVSAAITLAGTSHLSLTTDNATSSAISDGTVGVGGNLITVGTLTLTAPSGGIDANFDATTLNTTSSGTQFLQAANSVTIGTSGLTAGSSTITLGGGTFILGGSDRINDSTNVNVSGATFDIGDFSDTVNTLTLTSGAISGLSGVLTSTNTIQTLSGSASAILAGANGLTQSTGGLTTLSGTNTFTGITTVAEGTLLVNGSLASEMTVTGGILGGSGTVAGSVSISTGTIAPGNSPGILNTGDVNYTGGNLDIEINGNTPGNTASNHDQINVTGTVALGAGVTTLNLSGTYTTVMPTVMPTESLVIIKNDGTDDGTGYFAGLPEGSPIVFNTQTLYISYKGGDGNDVVLNTNIFNGTDNDDAFVLTYSSTETTGDVLVSLSTNGGAFQDLGRYPMNAPVTLMGMAGTDSVRVIGTAGSDTYAISSSGGLTINGAVLVLDSIETTTLAGAAGDDLYQFVADTAVGVYTLDESGGGIDTVDLSLTTTSGVAVNLGSATQQVVNSNLSLKLSSSTVFENATGGSGIDTLSGNSLANTLTGNAGHDKLNGKGGDDSLLGGSGDDTYVFGTATTAEADTVTEAASAGTDALSFSSLTTDVMLSLETIDVQSVHANRTLKLNATDVLENIVGGSGNDTLSGNALANTLTGNTGNDTLTGNGGNDSLVGRTGDDTYVFASATTPESDTVTEAAKRGTDTLSFSTLTTNVILNLRTTAVQTVHANRTLNLNTTNVFENIVGGSGNDMLTGNSLANTFTGNAGNDRLNGGSGNDSLVGGSGDDTYVFKTATTSESDTVTEAANRGTDRLSFSTLTTDVILNLRTTTVQTVHANRTLNLNTTNVFENIIGGSGNDTLTGNSLANTLTGNAGNDRLTGGSGNDSLVGKSGDDTYVFAVATTAEADTVTEGTSAGTDTLSFSTLTMDVILSLGTSVVQTAHVNRTLKLNSTNVFENIAGGSGNDTLTGNTLANILVGNAGGDTLNGSGGRDILIGGLGLDTLNGGDDEDIVIAGRTTSDALFSDLNRVLAEWVSVNSYATRISNLRAGVGSPAVSLKAKVNVLNDAGEDDSLVGGNGTDWYFRALDDLVTGLVTGEILDIL